MLALRWTGLEQIALEEIEPPVLGDAHGVRVRTSCAAVCTTDLHIIKGQFGHEFPRTLGHEVAGVVEETGSAVQSLRPGDGVTLQPTIFCGSCPACEAGNWHLCPNRQFVGLHADGGFAEQIIAPAKNWIALPAGVSARHACLVEPLACVLHAVEEMEATADSRAVITGAGPSAALFVGVLLAMGVPPKNLLVSGRRDCRLKIIGQMGVRVVDVRSEDFDAAIRDQFAREGPNLFVDQTGDVNLISDSLDQLARKGTLFIYDFMGDPRSCDFGRLQLREIRLLTSTGCPGTMDEAVDWIARGRVDLEPLITHEYSLPEAFVAFEKSQSKDPNHMKTIIRCGDAWSTDSGHPGIEQLGGISPLAWRSAPADHGVGHDHRFRRGKAGSQRKCGFDVQTNHGIIGSYGDHPSTVCDRADLVVSSPSTPQGERLVRYLDQALSEYTARYGDKVRQGPLAKHFEISEHSSGTLLRIFGISGHMGAVDQCEYLSILPKAWTDASVLEAGWI